MPDISGLLDTLQKTPPTSESDLKGQLSAHGYDLVPIGGAEGIADMPPKDMPLDKEPPMGEPPMEEPPGPGGDMLAKILGGGPEGPPTPPPPVRGRGELAKRRNAAAKSALSPKGPVV